MEAGASLYAISDKAAFPFKSDEKYSVNFLLDHAGFSLQLQWFRESEQIGWIRSMDNTFWEISLPTYSNIDFHLSKQIEIFKTKLIFNFTGQNILDDDTELEGLTIRDRRFYLTFGVQY